MQTQRSPPPIPDVVKYYNLDEIRRDAISIGESWSLLKSPESVVVLAKYDHQSGELVKRLVIHEDLTACLYFGELPVKQSWSLEKQTIRKLLVQIDSIHKCTGIQDPELQDVKCSTAYRFLSTKINLGGTPVHSSVIRSNVCQGFAMSDASRCSPCVQLRQNLHGKVQDSSNSRIHPKTPLHSLSRDSLIKELKSTRADVKKLEKLRKQLTTHAIKLSSEVSDGLTAVLANSGPAPHDNELMRLFWEEQKQAFAKDPRGMRWHPTLIRFAIFLHYHSPRAYEALRSTGVLRLPNKSTLRDYTNVINPSPGFQLQAFEDLKKQTADLPAEKRFVTLLHDEMSVKADLIFDQRSGDIIGFTNPETWSFDENMEDVEKLVATHVLVFMVVGVNSHIKMSLGHFPTRTFTGDDLYPMLWKAVGYLEMICELKVITSTSDKASHNQKLYRLHKVHEGTDVTTCTYKAWNSFSADDRCVFFISDPPHLLKTIRNNVSKSKAGGSRYLWNNEKHILWNHLYRVYADDVSRELYRTKLTYDHVHLTPSSTMSVRLAVQVLSQSVSKIMATYYPEDMSETSRFFALCNRFFDCLNVRSLNEARDKRNPDLAPYRSVDDPRFTFLKDEFLAYITKWYDSTQNRKGFTKTEKNKMFLSMQTYEGIVMTVNAFIEATKYLLQSGLPYVLSQDMCQDPLEEHFGRHRGLGSRHNNPSVYKFGHQENQLRLQRNLAFIFTPKGNTAGRHGEKRMVPISSSPLKKLKR